MESLDRARPGRRGLEHFQKYCSHSEIKKDEAVFLGFGFVSAQSQGFFEPAPSPKPRQSPKILAPNGYSIFSNAQVALPSRNNMAPVRGASADGSWTKLE